MMKDSIKQKIKSMLRWLQPGLGVKRWIITILLGTTVIALGLAVFVIDLYRRAPDTWWLPILSWASLRSLPRLARAAIFELIGVAIVIWGIIGLNKSLLGPFLRPGYTIVDRLEKHQSKNTDQRSWPLAGVMVFQPFCEV